MIYWLPTAIIASLFLAYGLGFKNGRRSGLEYAMQQINEKLLR